MSAKKSKCERKGDFLLRWGFAWDLKQDCGCIFHATPEEVKNFRRGGQIKPLVMFVAMGTEIEVLGLKSLWEARNKMAKSLVARGARNKNAKSLVKGAA